MENRRVAVRTLVETVLLSGSLSATASAQRMLDGIEGHRALQAVAAEGAHNELPVRGTVCSEHISLTVYGRIDRLYERGCVEEIKTTYASPERLEGGNPQHWAQARCYAHLYLEACDLPEMEIALTYLHLDTGEMTTFTRTESRAALAAFFADLTGLYLAMLEGAWAHMQALSAETRTMDFPFPAFRTGQRTFAEQTYYAIKTKAALMAQAPTGTGKTVAVLFPAIKALGEGHVERIFYLTARTTQQTAAVDAIQLLDVNQLRTVVLTAKEKICIYDQPVCREGDCPRAEGYYDRLPAALDEAARRGGIFTRDRVRALAEEYRLCPFELSLDLSTVCDVIIGDYNYAFDPRVRLQRFFTQRKCDCVLLIDEAHNLPDRARGMYSATLTRREIAEVRRTAPKGRKKGALYATLTKLMAALENCFDGKDAPCAVPEAPEALCAAADRALAALTEPDMPADAALARRLAFSISTFLYIESQYDEGYTTLFEGSKPSRRLTLFCADPAKKLAAVYKKCSSEILFSATLAPHAFYRDLCGLADGTAMLALPSPFPPENLAVLRMPLDTRYRAREATMDAVADAVAAFVQGRRAGNYLVFLPSHAYLLSALERLEARLPEAELLVQRPDMDDAARAALLARFQPAPAHVTVGLAVMGGIFAEGIDLPAERLCGAAIVGVGLPQLCLERDVLKDAYDALYSDGYRYAYLYPGVSRVLQAAGRVIRTNDDRGALLLIDERYGRADYRALLPAHWNVRAVRSCAALTEALHDFWEQKQRDG